MALRLQPLNAKMPVTQKGDLPSAHLVELLLLQHQKIVELESRIAALE